jgi:predicted transcriptional regulator of viral defense system
MDARDVDRLIAHLAERQYGVVGRRQLLDAGIGRGAIAPRLASGRLFRLHAGVYAVGHRAITARGRWLAAVLACGDGAVLSHRTAAALWGIRPSSSPRIEVTVPTEGGRARPGIVIHRSRAPLEATVHERIPVTTPARTLLDLAGTLDAAGLARAVEQAEVLRLFDLRAIEAALEMHRGRRGAARLRCALDDARFELTRSELERRFLRLCERHALPPPLVNALVGGLEVDFHWPALRLIVEMDSLRFHGTRTAFERDRARDAHLLAAGWRVLRFTHRRLAHEPGWIAGTIERVVARG